MNDLADRLKWCRRVSGLTVSQLAKAADVSLAYPTHLETRRQTNPTLDSVRQIATALGIEAHWLAFGSGQKPSEAALMRRGFEIRTGSGSKELVPSDDTTDTTAA